MAYDPFVEEDIPTMLNVKMVDFEHLLAHSDYISIHAPLTPDTRHMFSTDAFKLMKTGALLINTARGPLVDEAALAVALDKGQLAGAALDVLSDEPPSADFVLLNRENVILTPHTAYYSEDALLDLQTKAAEDVANVLSGKEPRYPVNKLD